ncbi:hypothetical protein MAA39_14575 [Lactiplantibacillus plantarum]|nr:hypothetical protein [Lactiplantibacillus plantarum]
MIIDANVYWLPDELFTDPALQAKFIQAVDNGQDSRATVSTNADGSKKIVIEEPIGQSSLDYFQNDYQLDHQLRDMDAGQVDMAVLKLPGCEEWLNLDLCRVFNRAVAKHVQKVTVGWLHWLRFLLMRMKKTLPNLITVLMNLDYAVFNYRPIMRMVT